LSELPREWRREVRAWARMNARFAGGTDARPSPGPNLEYYYYQTLLAAWDGSPTAAFRQRIATHMTKAMREAKERTAWTRIDEAFETQVHAFVRATLDGRRSRRFIDRVERFVDRIAGAASLNSLGMVALKCTAPGIPDFYQGSEAALTTLTDPDNRSRIDFEAIAALAQDDSCVGTRPLSVEKVEFTHALLSMRARRPALFSSGEYIPLQATGSLDQHVFAFLRRHGRDWVMVVIARAGAHHVDAEGRVQGATWDDTRLSVDTPVITWHNVWAAQEVVAASSIQLAELLGTTPVGVFEGRSGR
ncbi:MAG TPA: hypothetical protein VJQ83_05170, partial [Tepidiformaceae bacterium]|nr:hypothetical protein [Tepidiformaceae bacterium]